MKLHLLGLFASAVVTTGAFAADELVPGQDSGAFSWDGVYLGASAGYGWAASGEAKTVLGNGDPDFLFPDLKPSGFIGGLTVGDNHTIGRYMLGVEADISYFNGSDSQQALTDTDILTTEINWLATARLRTGLPIGRYLPYATAGLAIAGIDSNHLYQGQTDFGGETAVGWTAGIGFEYAVNTHWSMKMEYLYADLGTEKFAVPLAFSPLFAPAAADHIDHSMNVIRIGLNYQFD